MTRGVEVRSFEDLKKLSTSLARFSEQAAIATHDFERRIGLAKEELAGRISRLRHQVSCLQEAIEEAEQDDKKQRLVYQLEETEEMLRWARYAMNKLHQHEQSYRARASGFKNLVGEETKKARHLIAEILSDLEQYVASGEGSPATGSYGATRGSTAAASKVDFAANQNKFTDIGYCSDSNLPGGFRWVSLDEIDMGEISDELEFKKISRAEMDEGLEILKNEIAPAFEEKPACGSEYFFEEDKKAGLEIYEGKQRVYDAFFGESHIRLEKRTTDFHYGITNGRHRILLAREKGWKAIPARTIEF